jgi:hypothetical protein
MLLSRNGFPNGVERRSCSENWPLELPQRVKVKIVYDDIAKVCDNLC